MNTLSGYPISEIKWEVEHSNVARKHVGTITTYCEYIYSTLQMNPLKLTTSTIFRYEMLFLLRQLSKERNYKTLRSFIGECEMVSHMLEFSDKLEELKETYTKIAGRNYQNSLENLLEYVRSKKLKKEYVNDELITDVTAHCHTFITDVIEGVIHEQDVHAIISELVNKF